MEIVVHGRHSDVGQAFKDHCTVKLLRLERYDSRLMRIDVELTKDQHGDGDCMCVQLTARSRGPVVRAEACASSPYTAFEAALLKIEERLRRARSKRQASHSHSHHAHLVGAGAPVVEADLPADDALTDSSEDDDFGKIVAGLVVREKRHDGPPMSIEEALHQMELVGHDFFLFADAATGCPSVVYKRRAYDYGVLRLATS